MNALELHRYIQSPDSLPADSLEDLKLMMEAYPYFQTVKLLYLKRLSSFQNPDFECELKRLAIDVADRKVLYTLLKGKSSLQTDSLEDRKTPAASSFDLIDAFLASTHSNQAMSEKNEVLLIEPSVSTDYFQSSRYKKEQ